MFSVLDLDQHRTDTDAPVLADLLPDRPDVFQAAHCVGTNPGDWFPERGVNVGPLLRTCRGCPAQAECLVEALDRREMFGVWGGLTPRARRDLRRDGVVENRWGDGFLMDDETGDVIVVLNDDDPIDGCEAYYEAREERAAASA